MDLRINLASQDLLSAFYGQSSNLFTQLVTGTLHRGASFSFCGLTGLGDQTGRLRTGFFDQIGRASCRERV